MSNCLFFLNIVHIYVFVLDHAFQRLHSEHTTERKQDIKARAFLVLKRSQVGIGMRNLVIAWVLMGCK